MLDSLNPYAIEVLLFLLSLLVNLYDRRIMLLIALSRVMQVALGGIAAVVGVIIWEPRRSTRLVQSGDDGSKGVLASR